MIRGVAPVTVANVAAPVANVAAPIADIASANTQQDEQQPANPQEQMQIDEPTTFDFTSLTGTTAPLEGIILEKVHLLKVLMIKFKLIHKRILKYEIKVLCNLQ